MAIGPKKDPFGLINSDQKGLIKVFIITTLVYFVQ